MSKQENQHHWDLIISPTGNQSVAGFRELWRARDLIRLFVHRDFVAQYKQTVLGPLWHVIQPLITTLIFTVVFGRVAKIPTDSLPPFLFYLAGTVVWTYLSSVVLTTSTTLTANAHLFGKVYFPRLVIPVSVVLSRLIAFFIQFMLLIVFMAYFWMNGTEISVHMAVFLLPFLLLLTAIMSLGVGILVSALSTRYRDLSILITFGVQLWMFATPVVYPLSQVPERWQFWVGLNPATGIVEGFRYCMFGTGSISWSLIITTVMVSTALFFVAMNVFSKVEKNFVDTV